MADQHRIPNFHVPARACDCHMHVFGPLARYPGAPERSYTPREASLDAYRTMARILGLQRVVFVQASAYGTDNACLIDTLRAAGKSGRGVAVIDGQTSDEELLALHAAGVRGARVNAQTVGLRPTGEIRGLLRDTAERIAFLGWHIQLFAPLPAIAALAAEIAKLTVPIVIDHMGMARGPLGPQQDGFAALCDLVRDGTWVKVSGAYRISSDAPDFPDAAPIARALIDANPHRVIWGSDWPHTGKHGNAKLDAPPVIAYQPLDDGHLLSLLAGWVDDSTTLCRILVDNPATLYGFSESDVWTG